MFNDCLNSRKKVFELMEINSILIIPPNPSSLRNWDGEYKYRANADLLYLTGFDEPGTTLILQKTLEGEEKIILFVQPRDSEKETWVGRRLGPERAKEKFQVTETYDNTELDELLSNSFKEFQVLHYSFTNKELDEKIMDNFRKVRGHFIKKGTGIRIIKDSDIILGKLRLIKNKKEIEIIKKACQISSQAHKEIMQKMKSGIHENEIEFEFDYIIRKKGSSGPAYPSICAGGDNATILHYIDNSSVLKEGELFLIDAGCEYMHYASDITRTYPINGKFTDLQKEIYQIVLNAEKQAINECYVGNSLNKIHDVALRILVKGLVSLGVLTGEIDTLIEEESYKPYYMHGTGHSMGLDTHDIGTRKFFDSETKEFKDILLEEGMIFTVEPGLYFQSIVENLVPKFHGIGIRIEDDVLITKDGPFILTDVPKEIAEIESLMSQ